MELRYKIWLDNAGKAFGEGPYQLLLGIGKHGSLVQAAKDLNMSYSRAHGMMKTVSQNLGFPLLESQAGGSSGGGSQITAQGLALMRRYEAFMNESKQQLEELYYKHFQDLLELPQRPDEQPAPEPESEPTEQEPQFFQNPLLEPLHLQRREVVTLVGGGGKTSIMYALAEELAAGGAKVILTTTTKILLPEHGTVSRLLVSEPLGILDQLRQGMAPRDIVCLGGGVHDGKLDGLAADFVDEVAALGVADYILIEGDGSAGKPFKAPAQHEPVIPRRCTRVLNIVGIDALEVPLDAEHCHRPELIARITGLELGQTVLPEHIAQVLFSLEGGRKHLPPEAAWLPVINKIDTEDDIPKAKRIAQALVKAGAQEVVFASTLQRKLRVRLWNKANQA